MPSLEDMKREIIDIVDRNWNPWVKAAFYSDPEVESILVTLYEIWESQNRRGIPLDYATQEQLEVLYVKAQEYRDADPTRIARDMVWGERKPEPRRPKSFSQKVIDYLKKLGVLPNV